MIAARLAEYPLMGWSMTTPEIVKELEWIVPRDHQWDLRPVGQNVFQVVFPSKTDLTRVSKIQIIAIKGTKMFLHFEEWSATELDLFKLTKTWVRVYGCPYKLCSDYLALFAVGSLIGRVQEVDMAFTRQNSVVRMRVLVTDLKYIPKGTVDHVYDSVGYGIRFKIEGKGDQEKGDISMEEAGGVMIKRHLPIFRMILCQRRTRLMGIKTLQITLPRRPSIVAMIVQYKGSRWLLNLLFGWVFLIVLW
jgi:hypothetical protein